jgi:uncharacterized protein (TIGR02147 family)
MEYQNYRAYMQDFYSARKERSGFSWREFASLAGYASPVYLKLVCEGKTNLSEIGIERTAGAMGLVGTELRYFRVLVRFNQEKKPAPKKMYFKELREIARSCEITVVGEDQYDYYQSWRNPVLRELAPAMPGASAAEMASQIVPKTTAAEVKDALRLLLNTGMLVKDKNGNLQQSTHSVSTGILEISSLAVRDLHRQMGALAVESLDEVPAPERDISGLTLGLTENGFDRIKNEIADFRRHIVAIVNEESGMDRIYRLNMQLFPLTRKKAEGGSDE